MHILALRTVGLRRQIDLAINATRVLILFLFVSALSGVSNKTKNIIFSMFI